MEDIDIDDTAQERTLLASERTLLAAERTFSAWIRTGLAGIGGGFAIDRLIIFQTVSDRLLAKFTAGVLIIWGMTVFLFALLRYQRSVKRLKRATGYISPIRGTIIITVGLIFVSLILLYIVI